MRGRSKQPKISSLSRGRGKKHDDQIASYVAEQVTYHSASSGDGFDEQDGSDNSAVAPRNAATSLVGEDEALCFQKTALPSSRAKIPDLSFCEMNFLKYGSSAEPAQRSALEEIAKVNEQASVSSNGDISSYFEKIAPPSGKENINPDDFVRHNSRIPRKKPRTDESATHAKQPRKQGSESAPQLPVRKGEPAQRFDKNLSRQTPSSASRRENGEFRFRSRHTSVLRSSLSARDISDFSSLSVNFSGSASTERAIIELSDPSDSIVNWLRRTAHERLETPDDLQSLCGRNLPPDVRTPVVTFNEDLRSAGIERTILPNQYSLQGISEACATLGSTSSLTNSVAGNAGTPINDAEEENDLHLQLSVEPNSYQRLGSEIRRYSPHVDPMMRFHELANRMMMQGNDAEPRFQPNLAGSGSLRSPGPDQITLFNDQSYGAFNPLCLKEEHPEFQIYEQIDTFYNGEEEEARDASLSSHGQYGDLEDEELSISGSSFNNTELPAEEDEHQFRYGEGLGGQIMPNDYGCGPTGDQDFIDLEAEFGREQPSNMAAPMDMFVEDAGEQGGEVYHDYCRYLGSQKQQAPGGYAGMGDTQALPPELMGFWKPHRLY
ncbi:hypothetical protein Dda_1931 [Drechslerella dactyloides]|uniref:Uncharacterized protein n=1 Tax=Drechslerella dactyloides TaxID=74499 RepID=A0AAD6J2K5_DREDA|nr:hypothetical protein Dda_1931 [Drechslerella dactyloides]